jgi:hypothetical protein
MGHTPPHHHMAPPPLRAPPPHLPTPNIPVRHWSGGARLRVKTGWCCRWAQPGWDSTNQVQLLQEGGGR